MAEYMTQAEIAERERAVDVFIARVAMAEVLAPFHQALSGLVPFEFLSGPF